jgi:hypothetical protein
MSREPAASFSASVRLFIMSRDRAFIASGRLSVIFMTPSSTDFSRWDIDVLRDCGSAALR